MTFLITNLFFMTLTTLLIVPYNKYNLIKYLSYIFNKPKTKKLKNTVFTQKTSSIKTVNVKKPEDFNKKATNLNLIKNVKIISVFRLFVLFNLTSFLKSKILGSY